MFFRQHKRKIQTFMAHFAQRMYSNVMNLVFVVRISKQYQFLHLYKECAQGYIMKEIKQVHLLPELCQ